MDRVKGARASQLSRKDGKMKAKERREQRIVQKRFAQMQEITPSSEWTKVFSPQPNFACKVTALALIMLLVTAPRVDVFGGVESGRSYVSLRNQDVDSAKANTYVCFYNLTCSGVAEAGTDLIVLNATIGEGRAKGKATLRNALCEGDLTADTAVFIDSQVKGVVTVRKFDNVRGSVFDEIVLTGQREFPLKAGNKFKKITFKGEPGVVLVDSTSLVEEVVNGMIEKS